MLGRRRSRAWLSVVAGAGLLLGASVAVVRAGSSAGTGTSPGLGGFSLSARASGFDATYDSPSQTAHPTGEAAVPGTEATLSTGPIGFARSAIVWPGPLVGNIGSVILLTNPSAPPQVTTLNDPVRAEARSPQGPSDASYTATSAGATMTAHATLNDVKASGALKGADVPGVATVDNVKASSEDILTAVLGTAKATSKVSGIVLGPGGILTIDSVTSTATATTDGAVPTGSGHTVVSGLKVAGRQATVDENGVHFDPVSDPVNKQLNDTAAKALGQAFFDIRLSQPSFQKKGASESFDAGSLVVAWRPQGGLPVPGVPSGENDFVVVLGGASVNVNAVPSFAFLVPGVTLNPPVGGGPGGPSVASFSLQSSAASATLGGAVGPGGGGALASGPDSGIASTAPAALGGGERPASLEQGTPTATIVLILLGALLLAGGLKKLSTSALAVVPIGTTCPLERRAS